METTTNPEGNMTSSAPQFTYDVHSDTAAEEFFSLMARANVQQERIDAMKATRAQFLAEEARN